MDSSLCSNFLFFIFALVAIVHGQNFRKDAFTKAVCSDPKYAVLLVALTDVETYENTALKCAISCGRNTRCNFAVFRQATNWCKHVYKYDSNIMDPLPEYVNEEGCNVFRKNNKPLCQNDGVYDGEDACVCQGLYYGAECEGVADNVCQIRAWRRASENDYQTMSDSKLEMKVLIYENSKAKIFPATQFIKHANSAFKIQMLNFLVLDSSSETFVTPLKREFKYYSSTEKKMTTVFMEMPGSSTIHEVLMPNFTLWRRQALDPDRLFYGKNGEGSVASLINGISEGFRLLYRTDVIMGFIPLTGDVFFQAPTATLDSSFTSLRPPFYFTSRKFDAKSGRRFVLATGIVAGDYISSTVANKPTKWELDRCWTKLNITGEAEVSVQMLREIILSGQDIRLIMGDLISTDITMVIATNTDVVAIFPPYFPPWDGFSELNQLSPISFTMASVSKRLARCDMKFQGSNVYSVTNEFNEMALKWIVSTGSWTKIFKLQHGGDVLFGSRATVYSKAMGMKNIRICIQYSNLIFYCYGKMSITEIADGHLLFQTPAVLRPSFHEDGTFSGIRDQNCRRYVWLFSTTGKVDRASYAIGQPDGENAILQSKSYVTLTWYSDG